MMRNLLALSLVLVAACSPISKSPTGRTQLTLFSDAQVEAAGNEAYEEVKRTERLITSGPRYDILQKIGRDVAAYAGRDYNWEFILIDQDTMVNAWCMPGGKVAVYTGMYPMAANTGGLAAVMSHEIGHAIARHSNERASQGTLADLLASALSSQIGGSGNHDIWMAVFGAGTTLGILLPYSRTQESEADEIGIMMMARAGYDPMEAPALWDRMGAQGGSGPQFLSTHPNPSQRAAALRALLPAAQQEYDRAPVRQMSVPLPRR